MNPLGLCHFYPADPTIVSTLTPPKPLAKADHIKGLFLLAKTQPRPYIIVVFKGGTITLLGLLQELHTWSALARIPIYWPDETKDRHKPCISCCPFCAYTVQNDPAYLNHIVSAHYNANFTCGTCLSAVTSSCQQMKRHINECKGLDPPMLPSLQGLAAPPTASKESAHSGHSPKKSSQESKHAGRKKKGSSFWETATSHFSISGGLSRHGQARDLHGQHQPRKHGQINEVLLSTESKSHKKDKSSK